MLHKKFEDNTGKDNVRRSRQQTLQMNSHGMIPPSLSSSFPLMLIINRLLQKEESESSSIAGESVGNQRKCALSFLIGHFQS
ncbi:hypothetical protein CEXT_557011 [Caerostris extrusa]|uniref:Uncharacterized protein n=1 Tax=Caerostris extrusa TaxID=172846 RepID=A0AAV4RVQ6_CAEEX|nr:hypothetical protein CEXT_557011 [Caerostris extrusa]